jgi:hypothetical protein
MLYDLLLKDFFAEFELVYAVYKVLVTDPKTFTLLASAHN